MQSSLNRARLRLKWQQRNKWMFLLDYLIVIDKQPTPYQHTLRWRWRPRLLKIPKSECPDLWIRLPRHKWPISWENIEDPVVPLERNLYGHPLAGLMWERQFEQVLLQLRWEKEPNWECLFVHRKQWLLLLVFVDNIKMAGKKQEHGSLVEEIDEQRWSWPTNIISWPCVFGMYSTWMQTYWNNYWTIYQDVWITYFCWNNWKITGVGKASRKDSRVVLRHGRTCSKTRWAILWTGKQWSGAALQNVKSLLGWPSIQAGRTRISWRFVRSLLTNCLEMLVLGTNRNRKTRHSVVG